IARVVLDRLEVIGVQRRGPVILADQQRPRPRRQPPRQRRLPRADLAAEKIKSRAIGDVHASEYGTAPPSSPSSGPRASCALIIMSESRGVTAALERSRSV